MTSPSPAGATRASADGAATTSTGSSATGSTPESTTEPLRTVRELEHDLERRLAQAREVRTVVTRAEQEAAELHRRAVEEAARAAGQRRAELLAEAAQEADRVRAEGRSAADRVRRAAAARRPADVEHVLRVVVPGAAQGAAP